MENQYKWLGINDLENEGEYITANNEHLGFDSWQTDEPDNSKSNDYDQDAIRMDPNGNWSDSFVHFEHAFICIIEPLSFAVQSKQINFIIIPQNFLYKILNLIDSHYSFLHEYKNAIRYLKTLILNLIN